MLGADVKALGGVADAVGRVDTALSVSGAGSVASRVVLQLYDLAGLYFRAFYALPSSIVGPRGRPVNAIRGTVDMLARVIAEGCPARAVACLDVDWRPAWRVALVPSYKAHRVAGEPPMTTFSGEADAGAPASDAAVQRMAPSVSEEEVPDELAWQVPVILDVLDAVGIATAGAPECEADDVIGTLAEMEWTEPVEIVSGDRDLFQLVRDLPTPVTVRYVGGGMGNAAVIDTRLLHERYGVDGPGYAVMATLRGDPSDGLPGVPGVGEKTAARLVADHGSIEAVIAAAQQEPSSFSPALRGRIRGAVDYLRAATPVVHVRRDAAIEASTPTGSFRLPREAHDPGRLAALADEHSIGRSIERLLAVLADLPG